MFDLFFQIFYSNLSIKFGIHNLKGNQILFLKLLNNKKQKKFRDADYLFWYIYFIKYKNDFSFLSFLFILQFIYFLFSLVFLFEILFFVNNLNKN